MDHSKNNLSIIPEKAYQNHQRIVAFGVTGEYFWAACKFQ